ncbi:MAG: serine hydrolase domain-containing protein [Christensenellales bacterium]
MSPESRLRFELTRNHSERIARWARASCCAARPGRTRRFASARRACWARPRDGGNLLRVASVSKLVMTFGALALVERGVLGLDDDLSVYLGYPVRNPHFKDVPVTLRMLLTHTAAIRDEGNYGTRGMQKGCTLRELLENAENWLNAKPGEAFHYSNLGAGAAGMVMERAAEKPLDDIMQDLVFSPLAIRASYDPRRISPRSDLANGYSMRFPLPLLKYNAQALAKRKPEPFDPERDYLCAAGRLITDSRGMAALLGLLASHGEMGVLSAPSLDLMRAPQDGLGGVGQIGRGLNTAALPGVFPGFSPVGHQGVAYGMCAELFADPTTGAGVGVMTSGTRLNRDTPPLMRVGFDLLTLGLPRSKRISAAGFCALTGRLTRHNVVTMF